MLGKTLHLSEPSFPHGEVGRGMAAAIKVVVRIQRDNETKALGGDPNPAHAQLIGPTIMTMGNAFLGLQEQGKGPIHLCFLHP